jgi:sarcosine oxidase subunit alpha
LTDAAVQAGARIICGTSVWGIFSGWHLAVAPTDHHSTANDLPAGLNARAVIIATGAAQNPLVMNGWTLPGVITAGAAQTLINVHHVLPGKNAAVVGLDALSLAAAQLMSRAGATVHGIVLPPPNGLQPEPVSPASGIKTLARFSDYAPGRTLALIGKIAGKISRLAASLYPGSGIEIDGIRLLLRKAALAVHGENRAELIEIGRLAADGRITSHPPEKWPVDVVITSAGISPLTDLIQVAGSPLVHIPHLGGWVPVHRPGMETPLKGLFVAGSITGVEGSEVAEELGRLAGASAAAYLGLVSAPGGKEAIKKHQAAVHSARKRSLPFLPDIEKGRRQLPSQTV